MKKLPFYLTLSRIVGAPLVLLPFIESTNLMWWLAMLAFIALSITDYFDGALARKYNVVSNFGKYFDPTGDKILVLFALVLLVHFKGAHPAFLIILLSRDIILGAFRSYAASSGLVLAARMIGKVKTTFQMVAIPMMMAPVDLFEIPFFKIGTYTLWAACIISIISLFDYAFEMKKHIKN